MPQPTTRAPARPAPPAQPTGIVPCPACGAPIARRHCPECGEQRAADDDLSLRRALGSLAEHLTNLDGRLLRTVVLLVRRPGALLIEYRRGVRARYTRPLTLFLLVSAAFVVAESQLGFKLYNVASVVQRTAEREPAAPLARRVAEVRRATGRPVAQIARDVDVATAEAQRLLLLLAVPVIATLLGALYLGARVYLVEHVVLAVHLVVAFLVIVGALTGAAATLLRVTNAFPTLPHWLRSAAAVSGALQLTLTLAFGAHVALALRRARGDGWLAALLRAAALIAGLFASIGLYHRMVNWLVLRAL